MEDLNALIDFGITAPRREQNFLVKFWDTQVDLIFQKNIIFLYISLSKKSLLCWYSKKISKWFNGIYG